MRILILAITLILSACSDSGHILDQTNGPIQSSENKYETKQLDTQMLARLRKQLDNKIFYLTNSEEGCVISEKPLVGDIVIFYEDNGFKFNKVHPEIKKESGECVDQLVYVTDEPNYFYNINIRSQDLIRGYGLPLNDKQIIQDKNKIIGINLLGGKIPDKIKECFSSEGSHLNIWNNKEKLLHRYAYLDMELEASCRDNSAYNGGLLDFKK